MNLKVRIGPSSVTLTDKDYLAAGGQAAVYKHGGDAIKIYHDPKHAMPLAKVKELAAITATNVIRPIAPVYDEKTGACIGYSMKFLAGTEPVCKFFTKTFKIDRNVSPAQVNDLVKAMQTTLASIHGDKCLVVDFNELNILVDATSMTQPYFIDTDSYQTPSFRATAIMANIRDRSVPHGTFSQLTDWFSWGVLSFQAYINIHPYQGKHPAFKPNEWEKRMDKGISVFDKAVKLPPVCNPFSVIPKRHLDWFEATFARNERSVPPLPDSIAPVALPKQVVTIRAHDKLKVIDLGKAGDDIIDVFVCRSAVFCITKSGIWKDYVKQPLDLGHARKVLIAAVPSVGTPVVGLWNGNKLVFKLMTGEEVGTGNATAVFARNDAIYAPASGRLIQYSFISMGTRVVMQMKEVENVAVLSSQTYDGVLVQDLLGKKYVTVPYMLSRCATKPVPVLDGWRVIEAVGRGKWVIILAEHKGRYDRFILKFADDWQSIALHRRDEDIAYEAINFTVTATGTCLLLIEDKLQVWQTATVKEFDSPPLAADMKMFDIAGQVAFIHDDTVCRLTMSP